jgi:hypothetical protein
MWFLKLTKLQEQAEKNRQRYKSEIARLVREKARVAESCRQLAVENMAARKQGSRVAVQVFGGDGIFARTQSHPDCSTCVIAQMQAKLLPPHSGLSSQFSQN